MPTGDDSSRTDTGGGVQFPDFEDDVMVVCTRSDKVPQKLKMSHVTRHASRVTLTAVVRVLNVTYSI